MFAVKRHAEGTQQQPGFLVVGGCRADEDIDARDHFGWISSGRERKRGVVVSVCGEGRNERGKNWERRERKEGKGREGKGYLRIVIDLDLGEHAYDFGRKPEPHISVPVATAAAHALILLDTRHDQLDHLGQEAPHILALQFARHGHGPALCIIPLDDRGLGFEDGAAHVGDGLQRHASHAEGHRVLGRCADEAVHGNFLQRWYVAKRDRAPQEVEPMRASPRAPQRTVLMVGRGVIPAAQALRRGAW